MAFSINSHAAEEEKKRSSNLKVERVREGKGWEVGISRITTSDFAPLVVRLVEVVMTQESNMQILVVWEVRMG